jgi:peptidoglycan/LPS O-acetylase OafA/YrhL
MLANSATLRGATERLLWLDIARVLSAVMILGFHWLRPGYQLGLFGQTGFHLVMSYQWNTVGLQLFPDLFIAGFDPKLSTWLTNIIGIFGGFGWEAVSAFILFSGFSLAVSQKGKTLRPSDWLLWYRKRAERVLVPFYLVALPCLALAACAMVVLHYAHGSMASTLDAKLHSQFHTSLLGVVLSHTVLFDPFAPQWSANFFVPAWWFIPAILLAYLTYPLVRGASRIQHGLALLAVSAAITMLGYAGTNAGVLINESWYFIIVHESFNFSLGVVVANAWLGSGRPVLERIIASPVAFFGAFAVFVLGNLCDWTNPTRPIASMLFGPSLALMLVCIGKRLEGWRHAKKILNVDPYDLYLVHQPFAYPIALASKVLFHSYAVFFGWFIFVAVASMAAQVLTVAQRALRAASNRLRVRFNVPSGSALMTDKAS